MAQFTRYPFWRKEKKRHRSRRTEIQIETHEIWVIQFGSGLATAICERCSEQVSLISREQASHILRTTVTEVDKLIELNKVHLAGKTRDCPLICGKSLADERVFNNRAS